MRVAPTSYGNRQVSLSEDTRASLLLRLQDSGDTEAWTEFTQIYGPLIRRIAKRFDLQRADEEELQQDVWLVVHQKLSKFQSNGQRGAFRKWLMTVARNTAIDHLRSTATKHVMRHSMGWSQLVELAAPHSDALEKEYLYEEQKALFAWAADQVRSTCEPTTWSAFWETSVRQRDINAVAEELGMSVGQVYVARCRILARLRSMVEPFRT